MYDDDDIDDNDDDIDDDDDDNDDDYDDDEDDWSSAVAETAFEEDSESACRLKMYTGQYRNGLCINMVKTLRIKLYIKLYVFIVHSLLS